MLPSLGRVLVFGLVISAASGAMPAQAAGQAGRKRWEATERLLLDIKCTAATPMVFEFPGLSLSAEGFEITRSESTAPADAGFTNSVQLINSSGASVTGEARAYALSVRRLDS